MQNEFEIASDAEASRIIMELYDRGYSLAVFIIESILGAQVTRDEVEDLVQEGYLRMLIHVEQLQGRSDREKLAYLRSTMRNVALDEGKRRTKLKNVCSLDDDEYVDEAVSEELTPEERYIMEADTEEKMRCLKAVLERLDERDRQLLIEKYKNGLSDAEIAKKLGIKTRNVRVYLARARRKAAIYYGEIVNGRKQNDEPKDKPDRKAGSEGV